MRWLRSGVVGAILTMFTGCGGDSGGTTMPTGQVTMPPEMEQMKNDIEKRLLPLRNRYGHNKTQTHRPSAGSRS
jgi:hypothetical protein